MHRFNARQFSIMSDKDILYNYQADTVENAGLVVSRSQPLFVSPTPKIQYDYKAKLIVMN